MMPIERAARAAHAEHNDHHAAAAQAADPNWDGWKSWLPVVRVVLAAIREPSEAMLISGAKSRTDPNRFGGLDPDDTLRPEWQAMIDVAQIYNSQK